MPPIHLVTSFHFSTIPVQKPLRTCLPLSFSQPRVLPIHARTESLRFWIQPVTSLHFSPKPDRNPPIAFLPLPISHSSVLPTHRSTPNPSPPSQWATSAILPPIPDSSPPIRFAPFLISHSSDFPIQIRTRPGSFPSQVATSEIFLNPTSRPPMTSFPFWVRVDLTSPTAPEIAPGRSLKKSTTSATIFFTALNAPSTTARNFSLCL